MGFWSAKAKDSEWFYTTWQEPKTYPNLVVKLEDLQQASSSLCLEKAKRGDNLQFGKLFLLVFPSDMSIGPESLQVAPGSLQVAPWSLQVAPEPVRSYDIIYYITRGVSRSHAQIKGHLVKRKIPCSVVLRTVGISFNSEHSLLWDLRRTFHLPYLTNCDGSNCSSTSKVWDCFYKALYESVPSQSPPTLLHPYFSMAPVSLEIGK